MIAIKKSPWKRVGLGLVTVTSAAILAACGNGNKQTQKDEINWYTPIAVSYTHLDVYKRQQLI